MLTLSYFSPVFWSLLPNIHFWTTVMAFGTPSLQHALILWIWSGETHSESTWPLQTSWALHSHFWACLLSLPLTNTATHPPPPSTLMQRRGSVVASKPQPPRPKNSKLLSHKRKPTAALEAGKTSRTPHCLVQSTDNHHRPMWGPHHFCEI